MGALSVDSLTLNSLNVTGETKLSTSNGKVGINTTVPAQTLTVEGTLNVTSNPTRSGDLFVASGGNVGIGTTSPNSKLTVIGGVNVTGGLNVTTGNVLLGITSGNVGIATTSPSSTLQVVGTANITQAATSFRVTSDSNVVIHLE